MGSINNIDTKQMLLVTGANGYLGNYVVKQALAKGFRVRAITRTHQKTFEATNLEWIKHDLLESGDTHKILNGIDAVIHLAAQKHGSKDSQYSNTVTATINLLEAMLASKVTRLIAISSFSVFDYYNLNEGSTLDETTLLDQNPKYRDQYSQNKIIQENLFTKFKEKNNSVTILRPAMLYGKDNLWNAFIGYKLNNKIWLCIKSHRRLPMINVENCAAAIIHSVNCKPSTNETINLVDDDLPTQTNYIKEVANLDKSKPIIFYVNWRILNCIASLLFIVNKKLINNKIHVPGLLIPQSLHARFKNLEYSNKKAKTILSWQPKLSFNSTIQTISRDCIIERK